MEETPSLFPVEQAAPRGGHGPVRVALEAELSEVDGLPPSGVETLRLLADQIDRLHAWLAGQVKVRPFDTQPLAGLLHQWEETYRRVLGEGGQDDSLDRALREFNDAETRNRPAI